MKKLLSLLSVLTISGTAVPTVIAASPYQKQETIKNSDINYQKTNNLANLIRNKRLINNNIHNHNKTYFLNNSSLTPHDINYYINNLNIKNVLTIKTNGDAVYFATENGIYYIRSNSWTANKIGGINEPISQIAIANSNSVYFLGISGNAYYLYHDWWEAVRIDTYYNKPEIKNVLTIKTNGDAVYFATENGVYYIRSNSWTANKIYDINEPVAYIEIDRSNNVYFNSLFKVPEVIKNFQNNQAPEVIIDKNNPDDYVFTLLNNVYRYLIRERIIVPSGPAINGPGYAMNNQTGYFIVNINISNNNNRRLQLVFNRNNLYLDRFIVRNGSNDDSTGNYYYFSDAITRNLNQQNLQNINLGYSGAYNSFGMARVFWTNFI